MANVKDKDEANSAGYNAEQNVKRLDSSVEEALQNLGGFSWFQIWATFVILIPEIPAAMIAMLPIFAGSNNVEFSLSINGSITNKTIHSQDPQICSENFTATLTTSHDPNSHITSIVQEWNLVCSQAYLVDLFTSIQMLGMMTGAFTASQLADAFGRKTVFFATIATMGIFCIASGFSPYPTVYGICKYISGIGVGGFYVVYMIYLMEFLTPSWRTISGCLSVWSVGIIMLAGLAYLLPAWRHLTIVSALPALAVLGFYPFIPESPRWLLTKERTVEAEKGLRKISQMNGTLPLDKESIEFLQAVILSEKEGQGSSGENGDGNNNAAGKKQQSAFEIYKSPKLRYQLLLFLFGWFSVAFVYYGMSFNTKNLSGNPYLNVLYLGLVDLPAFPSGVLFNNWLGRRKTYAGYLMFAAVFLMALVAVDQTMTNASDSEWNQTLVTILCYMGRFGVAGAWGVAQCFTAESFPTVCRSTALGLCALMSNVGGVLAPLLVYLGTISASVPYFIFAGLSLASAAFAWLLSETNKIPLENFVKH